MAEHQDEHDALSKTDARVAWCEDDVASIESWAPGLRLLDSCTLPDGPTPVLDLLPPEMTAALPVMRQQPQVNSYRLSVFGTSA
jgi:hypothetical protein